MTDASVLGVYPSTTFPSTSSDFIPQYMGEGRGKELFSNLWLYRDLLIIFAP